MKKIDKLVEKAKQFILLDDRLLVYPLPLRSYSTTDTVLDDEANKGKNPMLDELKTVKKVVEINYKYQVAIVLAKSDNVKDLNIGDKIVYRLSNVIDFDLLKDVSMLKRFEIIAKMV